MARDRCLNNVRMHPCGRSRRPEPLPLANRIGDVRMNRSRIYRVWARYVFCVVACICTLRASAWTQPVPMTNCPTENPTTSWHDYILGKGLPPANGNNGFGGNEFSVEFRTAKTIGDPSAIGNLATNVCYTQSYIVRETGYPGKLGFWSWPVRGSATEPYDKSALPGDPAKQEINVYGIQLRYADDGRVLDRRGRAVGVLVCYVSTDVCSGY
jgi:hypothetical protein